MEGKNLDEKRKRLPTPGERKRLTPREREVLNLRKLGLKEQEIGERLGIGHRTVKCHTWRAVRKLGAANTAHAVYLATKEGIID